MLKLTELYAKKLILLFINLKKMRKESSPYNAHFACHIAWFPAALHIIVYLPLFCLPENCTIQVFLIPYWSHLFSLSWPLPQLVTNVGVPVSVLWLFLQVASLCRRFQSGSWHDWHLQQISCSLQPWPGQAIDISIQFNKRWKFPTCRLYNSSNFI